LWDYFLQLDTTLVAAIVAAVVSILTTILSILFTPLGNYLLAKRQLRDRLKTEYEYEQRKKLRDLIGLYHGRVLQAAEEMNYRLWNLYVSEGQRWLRVGSNYSEVGSNPDYYYFQSTVYRFLDLFAVVRRFETEALYVDSRIAEKTDFAFLAYLRAMLWVVTSTALFQGLRYDASRSTDHFFRDDLRRVCDACWIREEEGQYRFVSLDELRDRMGTQNVLDSVLDFFNDLHADEDRYRWDRFVALHLILLAFINDFGHQFQRATDTHMKDVADEFKTLRVPQNLLNWLPKLGLAEQGNVNKVQEALKTIVGE